MSGAHKDKERLNSVVLPDLAKEKTNKNKTIIKNSKAMSWKKAKIAQLAYFINLENYCFISQVQRCFKSIT